MIERTHHQIGLSSGTVFSDCEQHRYHLWPGWESIKRLVSFIMLNPSTADELANDPTIERCQRRAMAGAYRGLEIANRFALRSINAKALNAVEYPDNPIGIGSNKAIAEAASGASVVIRGRCKHRSYVDCGEGALGVPRTIRIRSHALKLNGNGTPAHPLHLPYSAQPYSME